MKKSLPLLLALVSALSLTAVARADMIDLTTEDVLVGLAPRGGAVVMVVVAVIVTAVLLRRMRKKK